MRTTVCVLGGLAILATSFNAALADDGCGRGRYYNGYRCAPIDSGGYYGPPEYRGAPPRNTSHASAAVTAHGRCRTPTATPWVADGYVVRSAGRCKTGSASPTEADSRASAVPATFANPTGVGGLPLRRPVV